MFHAGQVTLVACEVEGVEGGVTKMSLVTKVICMESEIIKGEIEVFSVNGQIKIGEAYGVVLYEKRQTKTTHGQIHKRIASLDDLKKQLINKLWNESGVEGDRLKYAFCHEFAPKESTTKLSGHCPDREVNSKNRK